MTDRRSLIGMLLTLIASLVTGDVLSAKPKKPKPKPRPKKKTMLVPVEKDGTYSKIELTWIDRGILEDEVGYRTVHNVMVNEAAREMKRKFLGKRILLVDRYYIPEKIEAINFTVGWDATPPKPCNDLPVRVVVKTSGKLTEKVLYPANRRVDVNYFRSLRGWLAQSENDMYLYPCKRDSYYSDCVS